MKYNKFLKWFSNYELTESNPTKHTLHPKDVGYKVYIALLKNQFI